ncbi:hypothetical protein ONS95_013434 [Cadophora gregata]|uniref:uncharacterized protein n=1 Tax=Cadophora gregata TaxID=51156 RepID=UPI0026DBBF3E|nr:uncharacterized protein ONS95_013434 [Cadophora gregata]KAK0099673.1 hypothetical protein ONS96_008169 [Cadophora gregata f. sp. sojae]KAK0116414.1 hypothetical protein ONS95_013434 [Cadophora gregata]
MSSSKPTIACFGATGGCVATSLACALKSGYNCTALARTPDELHNLLINEHGIPLETITRYLNVHQGNVKSPTDVRSVLINPIDHTLLVDIIVSGVGAYPTFQWSIKRPFPLTDPNICETAIGAIYSALSDLASTSRPPIVTNSTGQKPLLILVSTAGCGRNRGVPLPVYPQYYYLLGGPLADKKRMEELAFKDKGAHVRDFVIMRPLFLTDGIARGDGGLRVSWEWGVEGAEKRPNEPGPEIGYTVSRKDVGTWIFEKVICQGGWEGKCVYLTY